MRFTYAQQVDPLNGLYSAECKTGIEGEFRQWGPSDSEEFPQADRQLTADQCLVVDRQSGSVYAVDLTEAINSGMMIDGAVEIVDGQYIRQSVL